VVELAVLLLAIAVLLAFAEWRFGLLLCIVTAILQDPIRKITPDQPAFFIVFVGIVFAAACLGAAARGVPLTPGGVVGRYRHVATPMAILLLLIILQAVNSFVRYGNPMLTLIGLVTYLVPLPSFIFAYQLALRGGEASIRQFIKSYLSLTLLALTTVYLQHAGYDWSILGQVGRHFLIFDEQTGAIIQPNSGVFRAAEIAAWHAATAACFVVLLATWRKINIQTLLMAIIGVTLLVGIAVLTGRRKAVVEVAVFASTYFILWLVFQKSRAKLGILLVIAGLLGLGWLVGQLGNDSSDEVAERRSEYNVYVGRTKTVFGDAPQRFVELGIAPIMWAYDSFGVIGAGLGTGTQGGQYFGRDLVTAGAAEGGLGKITIELGIPGLFVVGWLAISVFKQLWRIMRASSRISPKVARLSYALFSFLVANVAAFSVATQAYGDIFILLILSWVLGFLFAIPALVEREARARRSVVFKEFAPAIRLKPV
jgi:hypothetical protein